MTTAFYDSDEKTDWFDRLSEEDKKELRNILAKNRNAVLPIPLAERIESKGLNFIRVSMPEEEEIPGRSHPFEPQIPPDVYDALKNTGRLDDPSEVKSN